MRRTRWSRGRMVPAQNRPRRSGLPSLKRFSGRSGSGSVIAAKLPVSGSKKWKPERIATTTPPASRTASEPTSSGAAQCSSRPLAGSKRWISHRLMSTQYRTWSCTSQSGPSPRSDRASKNAFDLAHRVTSVTFVLSKVDGLPIET